MPIYEYECQKCHEIIEVKQSLADAPLTTCPACEGELCKIISQTSFRLKGGGWYADGYSGNGKGKSCPAGDSAPAATPPCGKSTACGCNCG